MAGTETPNVKSETTSAPVENSNENPRDRNPPGGGNRGPRGRKGGTRFSGNRGGGMGGIGGGGGRNNEAMKMGDSMDGGMDNPMSEGMGGGMGGGGMGGGGMGMNRGGGMRGGGRGGRGGGDRSMPNRSQDDRLMERIMAISGPTHELPLQDTTEKKFSGRNRLYIGNLTNDVSEEEIQTMFQKYGEISELFVNKEKSFAFLRMDYKANAEAAKRELDGTMRKGRALKVRFAPHSSTIKIKNLTPWTSNELLERAFSVFGEIERAIVKVDERGKSTGEGIVEFCRKPSAQLALRKCTEGCYFITASLRPVVVEPFEQQDDVDGYPDKNLPRKNPEFFKARDIGPRFAQIGSFEHEYGTRWKQLHELYKQKEEALKREMAMEEEKLEAQMEFARYEHETELLREQLRMREADRERQKREWEMKERQAEEQRTREEELRRRQQEEMAMRIRRQEEELHRRQQENNLFMQEQAIRSGGGKNYDSVSNNDRDGYGQPDGGSGMPVIMDLMDMRVEMGNMGGNRGGSGGSGRWQGNDRNRPDDYPNKRRRY
ncbi:hrp65 protein isoform X2 [Linepithema humile]|uniref:hrp65 protein isoform X2 n=1 Tax=Linepithema humile TaxID=83485 RepID=UPI0006236297|nr:PREDICTED: hrp65 protein-like isoform X2 [Linepithema humile]